MAARAQQRGAGIRLALVRGRGRQGKSFLLRRAVQHPLKALEDAGFVERHDHMLRSRRPIYRLADPIVRFHHVITRADLARFEEALHRRVG